jgi:hypothetical protein
MGQSDSSQHRLRVWPRGIVQAAHPFSATFVLGAFGQSETGAKVVGCRAIGEGRRFYDQ